MKKLLGDLIVAVAVSLFAITSQVGAQNPAINVSGVVKDWNGAVVPMAEVVLSNQTTTSSVSVLCDADGEFLFKNVEPGRYILHAGWGGRMPTTFELPLIVQRSPLHLDITLGKACQSPIVKAEPMSDAEQETVFRLALNEAISRLTSDRDRTRDLVVSTENIKTEWTKRWNGPRVLFLSGSEVQIYANVADLKYLSFSEFRANSTCVAASINYAWAQGRNSGVVYMDGAGIVMEYRKVNGQWLGTYVGGWVS